MTENLNIPRLWTVFFSDGDRHAWWLRLFRPGYRHVAAAAWLPDQARWLYVDPCARGTVVEVYRADEFGPRWQTLLLNASLVLEVRSRPTRTLTPASFHCVGAIKALLGLRSRALSPWALSRHLLAHGAAIVPIPRRQIESEITALGLSRAGPAASAAGGPSHQG